MITDEFSEEAREEEVHNREREKTEELKVFSQIQQDLTEDAPDAVSNEYMLDA